MKTLVAAGAVFFAICLFSCDRPTPPSQAITAYADTAFYQEYHEGFIIGSDAFDNEVFGIAVDGTSGVWAATRSGVFRKAEGTREWKSIFSAAEAGPSFSVLVAGDGSIWMSTWNGVYRMRGDKPERMVGPEGPVARLRYGNGMICAFGPKGVWTYDGTEWRKRPELQVRSIRDAVIADDGDVWMGTDVGLYHLSNDSIEHYYKPEHTISAYVRGVDIDRNGRVWAGGFGGVSILEGGKAFAQLRPQDGIPSVEVNCVRRSPDDVMWVGTAKGVVRFAKDMSHTLRFSRRWLMNDEVNDITFDRDGNAWIATSSGVSVIKRKRMTLQSKESYFYDVLMQRHIREPWIAGQCRLPIAGDTSVWLPEDDDNDGEYTGMYLAMESFRYAVTQDPEAKDRARKAFEFLKYLQEVTGTEGFFARTMVPSDWREVHDGNRVYSERERAYELVKEPRFKPVEVRWHLSADGKWLWKGDTSSDEMCGHMMGYFFYYFLVADASERERVRDHILKIVDALMVNDYLLVDVDGGHTRWGVWSPAMLNKDPEWMPDRSLNSMEMLAVVKLAAAVSGDVRYENAYRALIEEHGYLENMSRISKQNPGWFIYYDVMLAAYMYPILLKCESDPELRAFYEAHMDDWFETYRRDGNPLINFLYCYSRDKRVALEESVALLQDTPLDLIDWPIDHTQREDVRIVRSPVLEDLQVDALPPASIRGTIRWDKNPYAARSGNPHVEREPVFWLLPYWMGRYLNMLEPAR